jgi:molybdopterin synthase catalytic subunit
MQIRVEITERTIAPTAMPTLAGVAGSIVEFQGLVRDKEDGQPIASLEYEAYDAMAIRTMTQILESLDHPCLAVHVVHRKGIVPVGQAAIVVQVWSKHRAAGFDLLRDFMDRLKQDVPIWKSRAWPAEKAG